MKRERGGLNYIEIFQEFNRENIKYIVCGGVALNLHGIPRMTYDIDILLKMDNRNIEKFLNLLKKWGFKPKVPVDIMDFVKNTNREKWIKGKHMKAFTLYNENWIISEFDILIDVPVDYKSAIKNITYVKVKNVKIPLISPRDLIKMKQKTGRKQDEADIRALKKLYEKKRV